MRPCDRQGAPREGTREVTGLHHSPSRQESHRIRIKQTQDGFRVTGTHRTWRALPVGTRALCCALGPSSCVPRVWLPVSRNPLGLTWAPHSPARRFRPIACPLPHCPAETAPVASSCFVFTNTKSLAPHLSELDLTFHSLCAESRCRAVQDIPLWVRWFRSAAWDVLPLQCFLVLPHQSHLTVPSHCPNTYSLWHRDPACPQEGQVSSKYPSQSLASAPPCPVPSLRAPHGSPPRLWGAFWRYPRGPKGEPPG